MSTKRGNNHVRVRQCDCVKYGGPVTRDLAPASSNAAAANSIGVEDFQTRLQLAREHCAEAGMSALLVTPGSDLLYLTGYKALPLERLTCLVVQADAEPFLLVPELESPAALASPVSDLDLEVVTWRETEDPYEIAAKRLRQPARLGFDNQMWAEKVLAFVRALPAAALGLAGEVISPMRMLKSAVEIAALEQAGAAIDVVHAQVAEILREGRTEREVGADISAAIIDSGHETVDFVIVASGPNGSSPHHDLSDRKIAIGEPIVVDIGGTMPSGYCSDSTRMYCLGKPPPDFVDYYAVLEAAQWQAVRSVRPGITAEDLDAAARDVIAGSGFGDQFVHRTGHGIGLDTHEDPYIVSGNKQQIQPGHVFSLEPGIYLPGRHGARIEDIVACTDAEPLVMNCRPRGLMMVEP
jgi:Xaa-Pro aminopeptidase